MAERDFGSDSSLSEPKTERELGYQRCEFNEPPVRRKDATSNSHEARAPRETVGKKSIGNPGQKSYV